MAKTFLLHNCHSLNFLYILSIGKIRIFSGDTHFEWLILCWQIMALKSREVTESINLNKETEGSCSNRSENSSDIKLDISRTPAIDSPMSTHPKSRNLFPTKSTSSVRPTAAAQLFHNSSSSRPDLQCQKIEQNMQGTKDQESLSSMFCGMDDQSGFWPWLEQHNFS